MVDKKIIIFIIFLVIYFCFKAKIRRGKMGMKSVEGEGVKMMSHKEFVKVVSEGKYKGEDEDEWIRRMTCAIISHNPKRCPNCWAMVMMEYGLRCDTVQLSKALGKAFGGNERDIGNTPIPV